MAWLILFTAGIVEIVMAAALKSAAGWSRPLPSAIGVAAALTSIFLLTYAIEKLPVGTAYAVWTGIGVIGVAALGIVAYGDSAPPIRLLCIALVLGGIIGLRLTDA